MTFSCPPFAGKRSDARGRETLSEPNPHLGFKVRMDGGDSAAFLRAESTHSVRLRGRFRRAIPAPALRRRTVPRLEVPIPPPCSLSGVITHHVILTHTPAPASAHTPSRYIVRDVRRRSSQTSPTVILVAQLAVHRRSSHLPAFCCGRKAPRPRCRQFFVLIVCCSGLHSCGRGRRGKRAIAMCSRGGGARLVCPTVGVAAPVSRRSRRRSVRFARTHLCPLRSARVHRVRLRQ